jgi:enoyl-CoA hydratase
MSDEIIIRVEGKAGRITLNRPKALNALTHAQCLAMEAALTGWRDDPAVALVIIDAVGDRAFCAGGDIAQIYRAGMAGDYALGRDFWFDEYRLNAMLGAWPKPILAFMQGFVMGGGVGLGGHVSHRIVGGSTQVAMPECGIGLIPDVGGTFLLARAPGRLGEYLGLTGARMGPGEAIAAGFADHFLPEDRWPATIARLCETGDAAVITPEPAPPSALDRAGIDALFGGDDLGAILRTVQAAAERGEALAVAAAKAMGHNSPLSMALTLQMIRAQRKDMVGPGALARALQREYRATWRAMPMGDFLEGVRAQIIDKDRAPRWRHKAVADVSGEDVSALLAPLAPADELPIADWRG